MIDDAKVANPSDLSPRAAIALMSLKLRSTVQEAIEAEAEADAVDTDAALWQLRSRLAPLLEDRRRALDEEVAAERERAASQIAAAHAEADRIVAAAVEEAAARIAAEEEVVAVRIAAETTARLAAAGEAPGADSAGNTANGTVSGGELAAPTVVAPVPTIVSTSDCPAVAETPLFDDPLSEWAPEANEASPPKPFRTPVTMPMPRVAPQRPAPPAPDAVGARPAMHVVIDAESFARAFAAALAPAFENRHVPYQAPPQGWMPSQAPAPKRSFWSHAWHPDVLLSGLAMVIVIIVLVAWTG